MTYVTLTPSLATLHYAVSSHHNKQLSKMTSTDSRTLSVIGVGSPMAHNRGGDRWFRPPNAGPGHCPDPGRYRGYDRTKSGRMARSSMLGRGGGFSRHFVTTSGFPNLLPVWDWWPSRTWFFITGDSMTFRAYKGTFASTSSFRILLLVWQSRTAKMEYQQCCLTSASYHDNDNDFIGMAANRLD